MPREHSCLCYCSIGKVSAPCHFLWTGQHLDEEGIDSGPAFIARMFAKAFAGEKCAGCASKGRETIIAAKQATKTKAELNMKLCTSCERTATDHLNRMRGAANERYDAKTTPAR